MRILFDHQIFSWQFFGGISRYFCEMYENFPDEIDVVNSTRFSSNEYLNHQKYGVKNFVTQRQFKGKVRLQTAFNKFNTIKLINKNQFDIFHPTYYSSYFLNESRINKPIVATFHDMTHELFVDDIAQDETAEDKLRLAKNADVIIAVSNQTKNDLLNVFDIPESKVKVVYHGISKLKEMLDDKPVFEFDYILYVGERLKYKNFEKALVAFSLFHEKFSSVKLVCTGKCFNQLELNMIQNLNLSNHVIHTYANEYLLSKLYSKALFLIYPSLNEGFGMPILEAMKYDCPVVISDIGCFKEVADNSAEYFNPYEVDDIYQSMFNVANSSQLRAEMIDKGRERVNLFTWEKTAYETAQIYKLLM